MSRFAWSFRMAAIVGPVAVLVCQVRTLPLVTPGQDAGFVVLGLTGLAVAVALPFLLGRALGTILRHGDLLVPLGIYITVDYFADYLLALPALAAVAAPWSTFNVSMIALTLSLAFVVQVALGVIYAGWVTRLILQVVTEGKVDLLSPPTRPWRLFGRVLVTESLGCGVLLAMAVLGVLIASGGAMPLGQIVIGVGSLLWNLATAALLPVVVASNQPVLPAIVAGIRVSWVEKSKWWPVLVVQMLLLGLVTYVSATVMTGDSHGSFSTPNKKEIWSVNGLWTGDYEDNSRWYGETAKAYETPKVPLVTTSLSIALAILAIAIKVHIIRDLWSPLVPSMEPLNDPAGWNAPSMNAKGVSDLAGPARPSHPCSVRATLTD